MRLFQGLGQAMRIALSALLANRTRGVLTTLGIIIGIVGVVSTMTAANGLSNSFKESVSALGSDVLYVSRMPWIMSGNFFQFRNRPNLTLKEATELERRLTDAVAVNPTLNTSKSLAFQSATLRSVGVVGTTDKHVQVSAVVPDLGRFLTGGDVQARRRVVVIGDGVRDGLFGRTEPLNESIRIGRHRFRVVGVMEKQGSAGFFGGPDFDSQVYVPITAFVRAFGGAREDLDIAVKVPTATGVSMADYEFRIIGEMRNIRRLTPTERDDFSINQMDSLVAMFNNVMGTVVLIGIVITGISLFVGAIGVMNIMFVSVTERTREIGIRKALGAHRRAILSQFLFESSAIGLVGGLVGLGAAFGVTEVIDRMLLPASISPGIAIVAIAVAGMVGVVSGLVPAWRASRLQPVEALRYE